jgi:hypothetical protein
MTVTGCGAVWSCSSRCLFSGNGAKNRVPPADLLHGGFDFGQHITAIADYIISSGGAA